MKTKYAETSGNFEGNNIENIVTSLLNKTLRDIGSKGVVVMRDAMSHNDYGENGLRESVMFTSKEESSATNSRHKLDKPSSRFEVDLGSADPNAVYTEYGTLAHTSSNNWELFVSEVTEWALSKGIDPEVIPAIIHHIRMNGTAAHPYVDKTMYDMEAVVAQTGKDFVSKFVQTLGHKTGPSTRAPLRG